MVGTRKGTEHQVTYFYIETEVYRFVDRYNEAVELGVRGGDVILHLEHEEYDEDRSVDLDLSPLEALSLGSQLIKAAELALTGGDL